MSHFKFFADFPLIKTFYTLQSVFRENKDKNIVLSPLSVKLLLTLLAEAAGQSVTSKTRTVGREISVRSDNLQSESLF